MGLVLGHGQERRLHRAIGPGGHELQLLRGRRSARRRSSGRCPVSEGMRSPGTCRVMSVTSDSRSASLQIDEQQLAGLQGVVARGRHRHHAEGVAARAPRARVDVAGLEVAVGEAAVLAAEGLPHARHVGVHEAQVAVVDVAEVTPLGVEHVAVRQQRRGHPVRDVARPQHLAAAVDVDGADLGGGLALVFVLELLGAVLHRLGGGEQDALPGQEDRIHVVVRAVGDLARVGAVDVQQEELVVRVLLPARRDHHGAGVEGEVPGHDVGLGEHGIAGQRGEAPVRRGRLQLHQTRARLVAGVVEDVAHAVVAGDPLQEDDGPNILRDARARRVRLDRTRGEARGERGQQRCGRESASELHAPRHVQGHGQRRGQARPRFPAAGPAGERRFQGKLRNRRLRGCATRVARAGRPGPGHNQRRMRLRRGA